MQDVIKLHKAGYSDDLIVEQLRRKQQHFDLTTDQLLQLKAAHVSEPVVKYMINPTPAAAAPCASPTTSKANTAPLPDTATPTDVGVYVKRAGEWTAIAPELVDWKSPGVLKSAASLSFVNGDRGGVVDGPMSRNSFVSPLEFLIVMPEGVTISDYQLVQLRRRGGDREFRIATGGITHASADNGRDMLVFVPARVSPRVYTVKLKVDAGEYGFLPPDSVTSRNDTALSKIFTFRIME